MIKDKQKILLFFLFSFSIYCALIIGESSDEKYNLSHGKTTLEYLFSMGKINNEVYYGQFYSPIYWSALYLLSKISPSAYQIETGHLLNLLFSFASIFGIGKLCEELFNKKVGKIAFIILFFYPIFFGHMAFNNKDIVLAFSHVWIFYLVIKYLKNQNLKDKVNNYIIFIGLISAAATGIQIVFLGSLITIFLFVLIDIFLLKKFICNNFKVSKFFVDILKIIAIFYFILTLFWVEVHPNIFKLQFEFFLSNLSEDVWRGWPYSLVNGKYYFSLAVPKLYFLINLIYKSPEYFLLCYIIFLYIVFKPNNFFKSSFANFNYKLFLILSILALPTFILFIVPFPVYDGLRLFLWVLPYFCILPALTIYFILENYKITSIKILSILISILFIFHLFNFFSLTPYQYTYQNILNGDPKERYKKFESDYWGVSIKELIKKSKFLNENKKLASCGINNTGAIKYYLNKNKFSNIEIVSPNENYDFIIMTNRITWGDNMEDLSKVQSCFEKFKGKNLSIVKRNGLVISTIREK